MSGGLDTRPSATTLDVEQLTKWAWEGRIRLQRRLDVRDVDLAECAAGTVERVLAEWPRYAGILDGRPRLQAAVDLSIGMKSKTLMRSEA
jgi:hypothetical protein